jgi:hypothetical protein
MPDRTIEDGADTNESLQMRAVELEIENEYLRSELNSRLFKVRGFGLIGLCYSQRKNDDGNWNDDKPSGRVGRGGTRSDGKD